MNAAAPDLSAAHAALHREREVRERYRGTFPDDPERRQAYEDVADKLSKAAQPLSPYVRRGPQIGRAVSDDPVRVTRKNLHAASKRVRAVLNRTSGTPTPKVPRPTSRAIWGHLSQLRQELYDIELEHEALKRARGSGGLISAPTGGWLRSMSELNDEAAEILERLNRARQRLHTQLGRYRRRTPYSYAEQDRLARIEASAADLRSYAAVLAAVNVSATRRTPISKHSAPYGREAPQQGQRRPAWDRDSAFAAIEEFVKRAGRMPKARELTPRADLPHYTTLHRLFGNSPLSHLRGLIELSAAGGPT